MYEVMDSFLQRETWSTLHALEDEAFMQALHNIVHDPQFSPERMGDYIRAKVGPARAQADQVAIERLVAGAWAVRDYLDANDLFRPLDVDGRPVAI